jgi:hypothetical protein
MALYISMKTPSPDLDKSPIDEAITFMATHIALEKRNGRIPKNGPALDITFMLSTKDDAPPFDGMRMGGYSDENNTLFFETAVPEGMSRSPNAPRYVMAVVQDAVDHAIQFFAENEIQFDADSWLRAMMYLSETDNPAGMPH